MAGSTTEGSSNVAEALTADLAGQLLTVDADTGDTTRGLAGTSPDGTVYKIVIANGGAISTTAV